MRLSKRITACVLSAVMAASVLTACNTSSTSGGDTSTTQSGTTSGGTNSGGTNGGDTSSNVEIVEAPTNGDTLKWLGYYDLNTDDKEIVDKFEDAGYKVEFLSTTSSEYFTRLATLIASSDSPDMVR